MSIFSKIFGGGESGGSPDAIRRTYVVDPVATGNGKNKRDRLAPGAQVKLLQRLARFAKREELPMAAVLVGKDLRAVQDGGDFQGVTVFFEPESGSYPARVASVVRERGRGAQVTIITDDPKVEQSATAVGAVPMRWSTLLKAMDLGGGGEGGGGGGSGSGGKKGPRNRPRNRRRRNDGEGEPRMSRQGGSDTVAVRDLIDLVE